MKVKDILTEQKYPIGIGVSHPGDPDYMDFWVFKWDNPEDTVSFLNNYLGNVLSKNNMYVEFYESLKESMPPKSWEGHEIYGPFEDIMDLI